MSTRLGAPAVPGVWSRCGLAVRVLRSADPGREEPRRSLADMRATWNDTVIATSDDTVVVEGNHYFPLDSVAEGVLQPTATTSHCPWKGDASYFSLTVDGETNTDAAWTYPEPYEAASQITDRVAFWKGVQVTG